MMNATKRRREQAAWADLSRLLKKSGKRSMTRPYGRAHLRQRGSDPARFRGGQFRRYVLA
jgi:hypothetical protein